MASFDDILSKGKNAANTVEDKSVWQQKISIIINELLQLNAMYGDNYAHNVLVEQSKCQNCSEISFVLVARNIEDTKSVMKFYQASWQPIDDTRYYCDKCK